MPLLRQAASRLFPCLFAVVVGLSFAAGRVPGVWAQETMPVLDVERTWSTLDDPSRDGWATEAFVLRAKPSLDGVAAMLDGRVTPDVAGARRLVTDGFVAGNLLPPDAREVFRQGPLEVRRAEARDGTPRAERGPAALVAALDALRSGLGPEAEISVDTKVVAVEIEADEVRTVQDVSIRGRNTEGPIGVHATWRAVWALPTGDEAPKLARLEALLFEQTSLRRAAGPLFEDATAAVLGGDAAWQQLARGFDQWAERIADWPRYENLATPAIAIGDVNGDGRDDLYLGQQAGLPNRLFVQQADGTAVDLSVAAGVDWLDDTRGALLIDIDDDGDQDLAVAGIGGVALAENDGTGRFELRGALATADDTMSLAAADFDEDGDLDLYVTSYFQNVRVGDERGAYIPAASNSFVYHDARSGGPNSLWRNDGDWSFRDVTTEAGLEHENHRYSLAAAWEDYDDDGDPDLYVANDYGPNQLFRNDGGRFVDAAREASAEDSASGMGITWADYDHDGDMDAYVSNMFSAAGRRVTQQARFKAHDPEIRRVLQRFARGNTLLRNDGEGTFADVSVEAGVHRGLWAWGALFVDVDNDGWEDLVVPNGYLTTDDTGDL